MALIEILIVGSHKDIMGTIARLINKQDNWNATIALHADEAFSKLNEMNFKLILLCAGIDQELELAEKLHQLYPNIPVVKHYGGGSGLLYAEIYQGLKD
jgi:PleD family two-component response regulator